MTIIIEITPDLARTIQDAAENTEISGEQMRSIFSLLAAQIKASPYVPQPCRPRVAGLSFGGSFKMREDFDDPLPDDFWLGDEATDPIQMR